MRLQKLTMLGVALLPVVGVASSAAAADGTSAAGPSTPPVHSTLVVPNTASFPSANPCTGSPGLVTLDELYVVKITTFAALGISAGCDRG
jgi:hypothetical protein